MITRDLPTQTVKELAEEYSKSKPKSAIVTNEDVRFDLTGDGEIVLTDKISVPVTSEGIKAFGDLLEIPSKFLLRVEEELQQTVLSNLMGKVGGESRVIYTKDGVAMVRDPNVKFIDPTRLMNIATKVINEEALVVENWVTSDDFRLDVIVPDGFDRGVGGDKKRGDITKGGIRIGQDVKHNTAPWVSEFLYRLACTNGMEVLDRELKVDARGSSVDEVLADFEVIADRAFRRVEESIKHFYELREQPIDNPERTLIRLGEENGLPDRTVGQLTHLAPTVGDEPTMFDVVNLITNQANEAGKKAGQRRKLQLTGGNIVFSHAERCDHCKARLN